MENKYLIKLLEENSGYYNVSFSNHYMNWKRYCSIRDALARELKRRGRLAPIKILDLGCGDGWIDFRLKAQFSQKFALNFVGVDLSALSIDLANQRKSYFGHPGCFFFPMDAQNLGLRGEQFDIVITSELIEHLTDPPLLMHEIRRILKNDGLCILTTPQQGGGLQVRLLHHLGNSGKDSDRNRSLDLGLIGENEMKRMKLSSGEGLSGAGYGHIAVKSRGEWERCFKKSGFKVQSVRGTGGLLFGAPYLDAKRVLFALALISDVILEKFSFSHLFSEILIFELRK